MFKVKGYRAKWCHPSIKKRIAAIRATDVFKKKSTQYSLNRKKPGQKIPIHCQGSKSTEQIRIELVCLLSLYSLEFIVFRKLLF